MVYELLHFETYLIGRLLQEVFYSSVSMRCSIYVKSSLFPHILPWIIVCVSPLLVILHCIYFHAAFQFLQFKLTVMWFKRGEFSAVIIRPWPFSGVLRVYCFNVQQSWFDITGAYAQVLHYFCIPMHPSSIPRQAVLKQITVWIFTFWTSLTSSESICKLLNHVNYQEYRNQPTKAGVGCNIL